MPENEQEQTTTEETQPTKFKIEVDGAEEELTAEEVVKFAQLGKASTKRFQEASELRKSAESDRQFAEDMKKVFESNDVEALTRAAPRLGLSKQQVDDIVARAKGNAETGEETETEVETETTPTKKGKQDGPTAEQILKAIEQKKTRASDLDPELQATLGVLLEPLIEQNIRAVLDKNERTRTIMSKGTAKQKERLLAQTREAIRPKVKSVKDLSNPEIQAAAAKEVVTWVEDIGMQVGSATAPGLGNSFRTPHAEKAFDPSNPPKRPKDGLEDPAYEDYIEQALQFRLATGGDDEHPGAAGSL